MASTRQALLVIIFASQKRQAVKLDFEREKWRIGSPGQKVGRTKQSKTCQDGGRSPNSGFGLPLPTSPTFAHYKNKNKSLILNSNQFIQFMVQIKTLKGRHLSPSYPWSYCLLTLPKEFLHVQNENVFIVTYIVMLNITYFIPLCPNDSILYVTCRTWLYLLIFFHFGGCFMSAHSQFPQSFFQLRHNFPSLRHAAFLSHFLLSPI